MYPMLGLSDRLKEQVKKNMKCGTWNLDVMVRAVCYTSYTLENLLIKGSRRTSEDIFLSSLLHAFDNNLVLATDRYIIDAIAQIKSQERRRVAIPFL